MQMHIVILKMSLNMSRSTERCDSDDEPTAAQEKDPLLMVPQPPRGRLPAVLAVRPERISYKHQKAMPNVHQKAMPSVHQKAMPSEHQSGLMNKELLFAKFASKNGPITNSFESLKKTPMHTSKAALTDTLPQKLDLKHLADKPSHLGNISPAYRDFVIKTEDIDLGFPPDHSPREADDDGDTDKNSMCDEEVPQINLGKKKHKNRKKNKLKGNYDTTTGQQACNRPNCEFIGSSRVQLNTHKREVHRNSRDYVCEHCVYTSASAADLRKHFRVHSGDMPYECQHSGCTFKGRHSNSLDYHQKKMHPTGEPLKCDVRGCVYSTYMPISLKNHYIKNHGNGKTVACDLCTYRCYLLADLRKHLRTHSGDTPYACDWPGCGYACKISSNLRKHKRIHTEERPYACELCTFRSNFISSLKAHKRIHTNERPYCCEQCGYRCNSTSNLKKHILQRHPGTIYSGPLSTGAAIRAARMAVEGERSNVGTIANATDGKELHPPQLKYEKDTAVS